MSISFTKYINITSGVTGAAAVRARELITRIFSSNPLIPTNSFAEFTSAAQVATYFGSASAEYARAAYYFGFVSKTISQPQKISFSSWVAANTAPIVYGAPLATATLAALQAIVSGNLNITIGTFNTTLSGLNFAGAANMAAVAALVQTAVRAYSAGGTQFTAATVTYDPVRAAFILTGGTVVTSGTVVIDILPAASGVDAGTALGWNDLNTINSWGSAAMTLTNTMIASVAASSNFATFAFISALSTTQNTELATWLNTVNLSYMFLVPVNSTTAAATSAALINLAGNALTLSPLPTEFPELLPGMILAATDYSKRNVSQNYMFQQSTPTAAVVTDANSAAYDALRVNYIGQTQTAGQMISFYQRGVLTGLATSPADMNVYANEIWFKSAVGDALLSLLLSVGQVSNNSTGRAQLLSTIQSVIEQGLFNGTISPGQLLNNTQIQVISSITGDNKAYLQVQTIGYWIDVSFVSYVTVDSRTEYQAVYTLIYAKNNAIRSVSGTHDLI